MSEWKKVRLGDYCEITSSKRCLASVRSKNGIPFFCSKEIICLDKGEDFEPTDFIPEELYNDIKAKYGVPTSGDLLLTTRGTNGIPYIYKPSDKFYFADGNLSWFKNFGKELSPQYLYYWFKSPLGIHEVDAISKGTAQKAVPIDGLRRIVLLTPSLHTQNRIVEILSRYDSLIENYQKQIKLLEEAAQRLYKEWFIDLRFPGHENTNIIDGVPEGWKKMPVDSIYSIKYGKNLSTKLITPTGKYPVYGANGVIGYYNVANCNNQVVLITSRGNGSGDVLMTYHKDSFITNNSFVVSPLDDYSYCQLPFTYQFLKNANFRAVRTGAAQPQLTNQSIHTVDVILPSKGIIIDYCNKAFYSNKKIIILRIQIRLLTEARDRLLPKLMSGEITV